MNAHFEGREGCGDNVDGGDGHSADSGGRGEGLCDEVVDGGEGRGCESVDGGKGCDDRVRECVHGVGNGVNGRDDQSTDLLMEGRDLAMMALMIGTAMVISWELR